MSRKPQKKDAREQSTRQLMGIDDITDYGIATRMGELVFFAVKPTNISVLPDTGVGARIYALLNVVKGMAEIEMLALNSKESFENNKAFYRQRANEEELPVIRKLLEQDSKHLDRIQVLMASSREFYILVRLQGKKESDVFSYLSRIEKSIKDRNVRGIGIALCLLTLFIFLSGCGSLKDDTLLTVNAVITEVDTGKQTITVKDDADENTLGEECLIDCSSTPMVYCDFATQKVTRISFEELQVNDKVIVSIRSSEMESFRSGGGENTIKVEQLQLYTQRAAG